jgi:hypothetical protein
MTPRYIVEKEDYIDLANVGYSIPVGTYWADSLTGLPVDPEAFRAHPECKQCYDGLVEEQIADDNDAGFSLAFRVCDCQDPGYVAHSEIMSQATIDPSFQF